MASGLFDLPKSAMPDALLGQVTGEPAKGALLPPLEPLQEVWVCGVTYLRSQDAHKADMDDTINERCERGGLDPAKRRRPEICSSGW